MRRYQPNLNEIYAWAKEFPGEGNQIADEFFARDNHFARDEEGEFELDEEGNRIENYSIYNCPRCGGMVKSIRGYTDPICPRCGHDLREESAWEALFTQSYSGGVRYREQYFAVRAKYKELFYGGKAPKNKTKFIKAWIAFDNLIYARTAHCCAAGELEENEIFKEGMRALMKIPAYSGKIWRGLHLTDEEAEDFLTKYREGAVVKEKFVQSWTNNKGTAFSFAHKGEYPVRVILETENGEARPIEWASLAPYPLNELLMPKAAFEVLSITRKEETRQRKIYNYYLDKFDEYEDKYILIFVKLKQTK